MLCPYCQKEMQRGIVSGDGRSKVYFNPSDKPKSLMDKLDGSGKLTAIKYTLATFRVEANYCDSCKKMIIDTDLSKY